MITVKTDITSTTNSKRIYAKAGDTITIIGQGDPVLICRNTRTGEKFPIHKSKYNEIHQSTIDSGHRELQQPAGSHKGNKVESTDKGNAAIGKGHKAAMESGRADSKQIGLFD